MYKRLSKVMTKSYYKEILEKVLIEAKHEYENAPELAFNQSIYNQLSDIKENVVNKKIIYSLEEAKERYPLGIMSIRHFDGYDSLDYKDMLVDISYGISRYCDMPED